MPNVQYWELDQLQPVSCADAIQYFQIWSMPYCLPKESESLRHRLQQSSDCSGDCPTDVSDLTISNLTCTDARQIQRGQRAMGLRGCKGVEWQGPMSRTMRDTTGMPAFSIMNACRTCTPCRIALAVVYRANPLSGVLLLRLL